MEGDHQNRTSASRSHVRLLEVVEVDTAAVHDQNHRNASVARDKTVGDRRRSNDKTEKRWKKGFPKCLTDFTVSSLLIKVWVRWKRYTTAFTATQGISDEARKDKPRAREES